MSASRSSRAPAPLTREDYRTLSENSPDIIDRFDRAFRHLYINPAGARIHGVEPRQLMGKTIRETGVPEPYSSLWEGRIRQVFQTGKPLELRDTFQGKNGVGYYESRCIPELAANGKVRSVLVVTRDITSLKRIEESMRESDVLLRKILELSPISMAIVSMDGKIEYINRKAIETFGYSPEDIPTMDDWWKRAYPNQRYRKSVIERWMGSVQMALVENQEIKGSEYQVTCKNGAVKTMFIFGVPVASKVFVLFNDVSAYKTLQGELEEARDGLESKVKDRTAKLQALAEEIIRVEHRERLRIAHVLHEDLQQWLAAAKFRLGELGDHTLTKPGEEAMDRVRHLLDKAIDVTRSLAVDLRPPVVHEQGLKMAMRWLASDMKNKFDLCVQIRGQGVSDRVAQEVGMFVFDAVRELLLNVVKHSGLKTAIIRFKSAGRGRFCVEVIDKGRGFDPCRNRPSKFGLFSIRERADVLGGSMNIVSEPGRGASVVLTLPFKENRSQVYKGTDAPVDRKT
ncbi:MAG: PAS domain S-box protein [bacterium]